MKKGGQKAKGSAFERRVAKILSEAYYPDGTGEFRRVPLSGGWDKRIVSGDLIPCKFISGDHYEGGEMVVDKSFPFSIECKDWCDIKHFFSGLYSQESAFFDWIKQADDDCRSSKKIPVVMFKLFRQEIVCMLKAEDFSKLTDIFGAVIDYKYYFLRRYPVMRNHTEMAESNLLVFLLLKDFLGWIDLDFFRMRQYIRSFKKP